MDFGTYICFLAIILILCAAWKEITERLDGILKEIKKGNKIQEIKKEIKRGSEE